MAEASTYFDGLSGDSNHRGYLRLYLTQNWRNLDGNYSNISWNLTVRPNGSQTAWSNYPSYWGASLSDGGHDGSFTYNLANGEVSIASGSFNIGHDYYGNQTISGSAWMSPDSPLGYASCGGSLALWRIPQYPTAPTSVTAASSGTLALRATAGGADGRGDTITSYQIELSAPGGGSWSGTVQTGTDVTFSGLTGGQNYKVRARAYGGRGYGAWAESGLVFIGAVPGAPTGVTAVAKAGLLNVSWTAPASDGGVAIDAYRIQYSTASNFSTGVVNVDVAPMVRSKSIVGLVPSTTYYARVVAHNTVGYSANSASANVTTPARSVLDIVQGAAVHLADGTQVELRSDGANSPTVTLVFTPFGIAQSTVTIDTIAVNGAAGTFYAPGGARNLALVADTTGNLFVIGADATATSTVLVKRYVRSSATVWAASGSLSQALTNTGDPLVAFAAAYVPGTGSTGAKPTILMLARRAGSTLAGSVSFGTVNVAAVAASSGALFVDSGNAPSWLSTAPTSGTFDTGIVDVVPVAANSTRLGVLADGYGIIDVVNGLVTGVAQAAANTAIPGPWAQVVAISATTVAVLSVSSGALTWSFYSSSGSLLGSGSYAAANAFGGAFASQWGACFDKVANVVTVYYLTATADGRTLASIDINPTTYAATAAVTLTAALGASGSANSAARIPLGVLDERRVRVVAANLNSGTKSAQIYDDVTGNAAPNAPTLVPVAGFDAASAFTLGWAFSDPNAADTQTAYELQVQRVSDSVNVVATSTVSSTAQTYALVANTLANGVNYRWRVRTTDVLGKVGAWSAYNAFTTSAIGTLTITYPAADNPAGLDVSTLPLAWSYVQANGYVQTQRRVRVIRVSDSVVLSDTTMQASTATTANVAVPTDVQVRVELSIITNAPGTPTVTANRLLTSSYSSPMTPTFTVSQGASFITVAVTNPAPSGARPEITSNVIERRASGTTDAFVGVAVIGRNASYDDHAVASGKSYDYRVRART